ncbi:HNH endonuclease [Tepidibacter mesophilus]
MGDDTVENGIAVCQNCHRRLHFGIRNTVLLL